MREVIAMIIGAMITYGLMSASPKTHVMAHHNNIINISGEAHLDVDNVKAVIDSVLADR